MLLAFLSWDRLHPLVVHFPVALLLTAPLFVMAALLIRNARVWLMYCAGCLLLLGTTAAFAALATGEAAGDAIRLSGTAKATLERHEDLAEATAFVFAGVTALAGVIIFAPMLLSRLNDRRIQIAALASLLAVLVAADVLLGVAAHQGGRLMHDPGIGAGGNGVAAPD
jgi:uncharacterized membrane protein